MNSRNSLLALMLVVSSLVACGGTPPPPSGTGATCPTSSTLTYANFGQDFMATYCTRCHSANLTGASRFDAPVGLNFDTRDEVFAQRVAIDAQAGSGPNGTFTTMPNDSPAPTPDERADLAEWLACGAP